MTVWLDDRDSVVNDFSSRPKHEKRHVFGWEMIAMNDDLSGLHKTDLEEGGAMRQVKISV